jgi:hypothetical protein
LDGGTAGWAVAAGLSGSDTGRALSLVIIVGGGATGGAAAAAGLDTAGGAVVPGVPTQIDSHQQNRRLIPEPVVRTAFKA